MNVPVLKSVQLRCGASPQAKNNNRVSPEKRYFTITQRNGKNSNGSIFFAFIGLKCPILKKQDNGVWGILRDFLNW